mgnify:CR=1 FL=1
MCTKCLVLEPRELVPNPGGLLVSLELARAATASCACFEQPISVMTAAGVAITHDYEIIELG